MLLKILYSVSTVKFGELNRLLVINSLTSEDSGKLQEMHHIRQSLVLAIKSKLSTNCSAYSTQLSRPPKSYHCQK